LVVDGGGAASITNSTFVGNTAPGSGGAIYFGNGTVLHSTFLDNAAGASAGEAIYATTSLALRGNIFADATPTEPQLIGGGVTDLGGNVFSTLALDETSLVAPHVSTQFTLAPAVLFATSVVADNGGDVPTLALSATSPAIDAVPVGAPATTLDARGETRGTLSDAGAYEFIAPAAPAGPTLPPTGIDSGFFASLAAGLLATGALVLGALSLRRRQPRRESARS
jgi:predicted outer membrane repeat protein